VEEEEHPNLPALATFLLRNLLPPGKTTLRITRLQTPIIFTLLLITWS
jgi:hypothetical protein